MAEELNTLFATLKEEMKIAGKTQRDIAEALHLSLPTVKQAFSTKNLRLDRLERICHEVLGYEMSELYRRMDNRTRKVSALTREQEQMLASNSVLLTVAICALNNWTPQEIVDAYQIQMTECRSLLAELEKLNLISVQSDTHIRLLIDKNFDWLPDGPIERLVVSQITPEFLNAAFDQPGEVRVFKTGMLSAASMQELSRRIEKLVDSFLLLNEDDSRLQLGHRVGTSMLIAVRPFEARAFTELRRS